MAHTRPSRRQMLQLLGSAPVLAAEVVRAGASQPRAASSRTHLCLVSRHLQWTNPEEAVAVAAAGDCKAIAWTVRPGAHILAENVERDLPKAVELAHKAGLATPMVITAIVDAQSARAEAILETMRGLGIRYYRAPSFRYDLTQELESQLEALQPRIASLVRLNEKYGTTAMYHTHSATGNVGGGVWDLWLALRNFDSEFVGLNYDLGHATIRGGSGWVETSRFAHKYVHGLSVKDFRWIKQPGNARAASTSAWSPEMVPPGEGMVDFKGMLAYFKSVGFAGPVELYQEYEVEIPGTSARVNMLGTAYGKWKLEMSKERYISLLKRDVKFYTAALTEAGLL